MCQSCQGPLNPEQEKDVNEANIMGANEAPISDLLEENWHTPTNNYVARFDNQHQQHRSRRLSQNYLKESNKGKEIEATQKSNKNK